MVKDEPEPMGRVFARAAWAAPVVAAALAFSLLQGGAKSGFDPAMSRLATVYSLYHAQTFRIDLPENPFEGRTIDKVMVYGEEHEGKVAGGHLISSKPPVLPLFMTAEYAVLHTFGLSLDEPADAGPILAWMTVFLAGIPWAAALAGFALCAARLTKDPLSPALLPLALHFSTQCWGYSTTLNNHIPAAAAVIACWGIAAGAATPGRRPSSARLVWFGLCAALVFALDLPGTALAVPPGLWLAWRSRWTGFAWLVLGAAPVLALHFGATWLASGSPLPVQLRPETYQYPGSYWLEPRGIDALDEPKWVYILNMTLGRKGIFLLFPVLLLGVSAFARALFERAMPWRGGILAAGGACLTVATYYAWGTNNYGGESFGFRWLIVCMPVLLLMAAPGFARWQRGWRWGVLAVMLAIGFYSAWQSTQKVWAANREWPTRFLGPSYTVK